MAERLAGVKKYDDNMVMVDYYQTVEDLIVRIDCMTLDQVATFHEIFTKLSQTPGFTIDLVQSPNVVPFWMSAFVLSALPGNMPTYRRLAVEAKERKIRWRMNSFEWDMTAGLIRAILDGRQPGHQYLGVVDEDIEEDRNDALVMFAYQERSDVFRTGC